MVDSFFGQVPDFLIRISRIFLAFDYHGKPGAYSMQSFFIVILWFLLFILILFFSKNILQEGNRIQILGTKTLLFSLQVLIYIFYLPCCYAFSSCFSVLGSGIGFYIIFPILFLNVLFFTAIIFMSTRTINYFSNPNFGLFCSFDGKFNSKMIIFSGFVTIITGLFPLINNVLKYVLILLKLIITLYLISDIILFPYVQKYTNAYVAASLIGFIFFDCFHLCFLSFLNIESLLIVLFFIFPVLFFFVLFGFIIYSNLKM
jgi:hypothetical protein